MPGYQVKHEHIAVGGVDDLQIRSLLDRDQYADPLGLAEALGISSAQWPLFGLLWPSGYQLAEVMARRPVRAEEHILELGCGLALASLVAHRRGATVTASDCHPLAESFLDENQRLNGLAGLHYRHGQWGPEEAAEALSESVSGRSGVPGRAMRVQGRFELIIGSDVLYERDQTGELPAFIDRHATADSEVLIIDPDRGNRSAFTRRMGAMGYQLTETRLRDEVGSPRGLYRGRLLHYCRGDRPAG